MSIHRTRSARPTKQFRRDFVAGLTHQLHECAPKWTVHVVTAAAVQMDWMDCGSLRMMCKLTSCDKRLCMITANMTAIGNVRSSHELSRVLHELIIVGILGHRRRHGNAACSASKRPTDRCDGWWWTRQTCYACPDTSTCRYACGSSRSNARDATSCMAMVAPREASLRACVASHSDVSHGPARPDHEQTWLLRFACDAWAKIQATYQRF